MTLPTPALAKYKLPPSVPPLSFEELSLQTISSELNLLKTLPSFYTNNVLSSTASQLVSLKDIQGAELSAELSQLWSRRAKHSLSLLKYFDAKRSSLEPVFNENDSTMVTILKSTRGESLLSDLRSQIFLLIAEVDSQDEAAVENRIRSCLFLLGEIGELLNNKFPWADDIPTEGTETLPRLCGRAKVTFAIQRPANTKLPLLSALLPATTMTPLGNITIVADGFTAPLTAGNFVDLARRGFYTGIPVREKPKRVGDIGMNVRILGSFNEGFNDPFTAKLRTIPLEIINANKKMTYGTGTQSSSSSSSSSSTTTTTTTSPSPRSSSYVSLQSPAVVAFNHPERKRNGGSSEFFFLTKKTLPLGQAMDGNYAPFGFIVEGFDLANSLLPGDVITSTTIDEWGLAGLEKKEVEFSEFR